MMIDATGIERLIAYEKHSSAFLWRCFWIFVSLFLGLLALNLIMGWLSNIGSALGNLLTGALTYLPLAQISKRKDHIAALTILKDSLPQSGRKGTDHAKVESIILGRIEKMLEG